jgi:hypothetical protein
MMPASFFVRRVEHVFLIKQGENAVVPACAYSLRFKVFVILSFLDKILMHLIIYYQRVRSTYQPPASSTFLSEQTNHQRPASSTLLSEETSTSHQPPANRTGCMSGMYVEKS